MKAKGDFSSNPDKIVTTHATTRMNPPPQKNSPEIQDVKLITKELPFMTETQALWISDLIRRESLASVLEVGFFHGVSTCYLASAVAPLGGHVTSLDIPYSAGLNPTAEELLQSCGLAPFVTLVREPAGAAWHLMKLISARQRFDLCYIDDAHTWNVTGLHFFLAEKLLRPGGFLLFDDLNWTVNGSKSGNVTGHNQTDEQKETAQVGKVWNLLVKEHVNLTNFKEYHGFGLCQKRQIAGTDRPELSHGVQHSGA
jgi:predicted O-methyltransferase YrrM